jgi:hypothetical protein
MDSSKTKLPITDTLEITPVSEDSAGLIPAKADTIEEVDDTVEVKPDSVIIPEKSINVDEDEGNQQQEQLQNEDSAEAADVGNSSEKEISSDSVITKQVLPAAADSAAVMQEMKADSVQQSDSLFIEEKEEKISVPEDSNTIKE